MANVVRPTSATDYATKAYVDDAIAAIGSSYTPPTTQEKFDACTDVSVTAGSGANLRWDQISSGSGLVSIATDTAPAIITPGIYAVVARIAPDTNMTAGKSYTLTLKLNGFIVYGVDVSASAALPNPQHSVVGIGYLQAGETIQVVAHNDDTGNKNFAIQSATIQRIT